MDLSKINLEKLNNEELTKLRRNLAIRRSTIDSILDKQAFGHGSDDVDELNEEFDKCEEIIKKIDTMLSIKKR